MRYARIALLVCVVDTLVLSNHHSRATTPSAIQPVETKTAALTDSIVQEVSPTDSSVKSLEDVDGQRQPPSKIILVKVPKEYADWFKGQTGSDALDRQQIEAKIDGYGAKVDLEGGDEHYISIRLPGVPEQKISGWKMSVVQVKSTNVDREGTAVLDGEIRVEVYPSHLCIFPFTATIKVDPEAQRHLSAPPLKATIKWTRPQYSKKGEN